MRPGGWAKREVLSTGALLIGLAAIMGGVSFADPGGEGCVACASGPSAIGSMGEATPAGLASLIDTRDFPPRWRCGTWSGVHGWTHIVADLVTWVAYTMIPIALIWFVRGRADLPFPAIFWLFGAFIVACGLTHLMEALMFWWPAYRLMGVVKVGTAIVSLATAVALIPLIPRALRLKGPRELEEVVRQRTAELAAANESLTASRAELAATNAELEEKVAVRTERLQRSNQELERFAYVASHDLKAPLRGLRHLATWIKEDLGGDVHEDTQKHLELLDARVRRMDSLLDDLLAYSRVGRTDTDVEVVDCRALLESIVTLVRPPGSLCEIRIGEGMPTLETARVPLEQVFQNLIGNAIKHHDKPSGVIGVTVRDIGDRYEFAVSDDGPGIDPRFHGRVFGMFQKLRSRDEIEGSGMGLALVEKTVIGRGGAVLLESEPGKGSTFRFTWLKEPVESADTA